jgi:hypothetical protein
MVNLDMVGRLLSNRLTVYGTGTGTLIADHVRHHGKLAQIELDEEPSGYGPSDHQSFYQQKIPVLHFFTGLHNDYHRPSDDFEKINFSGMVRITDVTTGVVWDLARDPARPVYQSTRRGGPMRQQPTAALGVSLDMESKEMGATIREVNRGGAAFEAGLLPGDRILSLDDSEVASADQFRAQIRTCTIGQTVKLKVQRGTDALEIEVQLKASTN